jgi:hypothetical protein
LVDRTKKGIFKTTLVIRAFTIAVHTLLLPSALYFQLVNSMHLLIQLVILFVFLVTAVESYAGDRRSSTTSSTTKYPSTSFSAQEQALFGNCNAEDCIFGSPSANFGPKDVEELKEQEPTKSVPETDKLAAEFGPPPTAFIRKH